MEKITKYTYALIDEKTKKIIEFIEVENGIEALGYAKGLSNQMKKKIYAYARCGMQD